MLGKIRNIALAAVTVGGFTLVGGVTEAKAAPTTCVIDAQTANVSSSYSPNGGLYYPTTDPGIAGNALSGGPDYTWTFNGVCKDSGVTFESSGIGKGWCGRSIGIGSGKDSTGRTYRVQWESVGTQLILVDPSARGSVNANPLASIGTGESCTNGSAKTFTVTGAIVVS